MRSRIVRGKKLAVAATFVAAVLIAPATADAGTITPNTFTDDNTANGNCTLREAIRAANANAAIDACTAGTGADTIPLAAGTYSLSVPGAGEDAAATGDLDITDTAGLAINGNAGGTTVNGSGIDGVFEILTNASASLDRLTITGGTRAHGGGVEAQLPGAKATITNSTLTNNTATFTGGAIDVFSPAAAATVTLINSTVSGNTAPNTGNNGSGGGINVEDNAVFNATNSTISGNSAVVNGGGMFVQTTATANLLSSTITANTAANGGGTFQTAANAVLNLKGSILAGNTATTAGPDCRGAGSVNSQGNNLIGSTSGCTITPQGSDITGKNPLLGPLADNGGPTQTHALAANSPAINKGPADAPPTDQRGVPRNPDIGAYEYVTCRGVVVNRVGTNGTDSLTGTAAADGFLLQGGDDTASGLGGKDGLCGGDGKDTLNGGSGNDKARGDAGKDKVRGGSGKDNLNGGAGKDKLFGGGGKDKLKGGAGKDKLFGGGGKDKLKGGAGKDTCKGGGGKDKASSCERRKKIP
jgi:CSLREA domain-containing protein